MQKTHKVTLDGSKIHDFPSFHEAFKEAFGFADFYGMNMNAWNDCMSNIHFKTELTKLYIPGDTILILEINNTKHIEDSDPEILKALIECTAFVNTHGIKHEDPSHEPIQLLTWYE